MPKTYTVKEFAKAIGVSTNTVYKYLEEGRIKSIRFGEEGRFRIPESELVKSLGASPVVAAPIFRPVQITPAPVPVTVNKFWNSRTVSLTVSIAVLLVLPLVFRLWNNRVSSGLAQSLASIPSYLTVDKLLYAKVAGAPVGTVILPDNSYSSYRIISGRLETLNTGNRFVDAVIISPSNEQLTGLFTPGLPFTFSLKNGRETQARVLDQAVIPVTLKDGRTLALKLLEGQITGNQISGFFKAQTFDTGFYVIGQIDPKSLEITRISLNHGAPILSDTQAVIAYQALGAVSSPEIANLYRPLLTLDGELSTWSFADTIPQSENKSISEVIDYIDSQIKSKYSSPYAVAQLTSAQNFLTITPSLGGYQLSINLQDTINSDSIINHTINSSDLSDDSVSSSNIIDHTITNNDISNDTVSAGQLSNTLTFSAGDLIDLSAISHTTSAPQGFILPNTTATPADPASGKGYLAYDATNNRVVVFNGSLWTPVSTPLSLYSGTASSSAAFSQSGLELVNSDQLSLIRGCLNTQVLKWNSTTSDWQCADDAGSAGTGISVIKENNALVVSSAADIDFTGTDFTVTDTGGGQGNIAIDYANSGITRTGQSQTVTGSWTFSNLNLSDTSVPLTGTSFAFDFNSVSDRTLTIANSGAGAANLTVEGNVSGTSLTATGLTNAGVVTNAAGGALSTLPGTATTVLHGNASGTPSFASVTGSDLAANIGISTTGNIGTTGTGTVTSAGTLTAQGALAVNGNTTLGDAATDQITVTGEVLGATPLSFEGATDNNIYTVFAFTDPTVSTKTITFPNASLTVNAAADISGTTLASNVVTSSLTTVGALTSGSIATGFGSISTANNISTTGTGTVTSAGAFSGPTSGNTINGLIINNGDVTLGAGKLLVITGGAGNPAATNGTLWYDTTANKYKVVESGTVKTLCNTTDLGCGSAGAGIATVKEGGANVVTSALAANLAASDFVVTDETGGQAGIAIDYTNGQAAATGAKGFLTAADWNTFNGKQDVLWQKSAGAVSPAFITDDLLIGSSATSSARFSVVSGTGNTAVAGTFTASGNTTLGDAATDQITVTGEVLGATPLSFEGATDNNIYTVFAFTDPTVSTKTITFPNASLTVNAAADISGTTLASNVVTSSLTTVGALTSGSIATGFGSISTANNISTTGTGTVTSAGAFSGPTSGNTINGLIISSGALSGVSTLNASGQITSTVTTGTAPFVIASTTNVANLNASSLNGATFASPGNIGTGTAGTGTFTSLTATGLTNAGVVTNAAGGALSTLPGTATTVLHGNASGTPSFASVTGSDLAANIGISTTGNIGTTGTGTVTSAGTLTAQGALAVNGNTTLGDAATDQITVTGEVLGATPLSFEGATDNNIYTVFAFTDPTVSTKTITFPNASLTVNAAADISGTTLASNVVTSSLTTVGALTSGSIATGFGSISTANNISTTGTGTVTSAGAFSGPTSGNTINGLIINNGDVTLGAGKLLVITGGAGNPAATNGTLWYDTTANKYKVVESGTVKTLCNTTDLGCGSAGAGIATVKEGGANVVTSALAANLAASDFVVTDETGGQAGIAIDYTNGQAAATGAKGFLTAADWNTFNGKQDVLWQKSAGAVSPAFITDDLLIGSSATSSARFSVVSGTGNTAVAGTFTASGNTTLGDAATDQITVTGEVLGATPLSFEGATDNNIYTVFAFTDPTVSTKTITFPNASLTVNAAADISGTTLASNVVTSSLTTVGALTSGSIATGFGSISTANNISTTGTGTVTSAGAFSGPTSGNTINGLIISSGALSGVSTLNASGQITSTVTTGTAPFVIASTTNVANLNASSLNGATFASPGNIGTGTAGTGTFTSLTATGLTNAGVVTNAAGGALSTLPGTATTVLHGNASGTPSFASVTGSDLAANIGISTTGNIGTTGTGTVTSAGTLTAQGALAVNGNTTLGDAATDQITVTGEVLGATPLSFEGATDNNIYTVFAFTDPTVSTKTITFPNASLTVNAAADISGTTLASNVVTSSLTTVGALTSGSIATGFGSISTANNISTTGTGTVTSAGAFSGPTSGNTINGLIISSGALSGVSTLNASGQITSTVTTGTAPFVIASTTNVANLNASSLNGATFASPGNIGTGTAGTGTFTSLTATGLTNAGVVTNAAGGALSTLPGTATTVLHGNASGTPSFASVTGSDLAANIGISTTGNIGTTGTGTVTSAGTLTAQGALAVNGNTTLGDAATDQITVTGEVLGATPLSFEGATDNNIYTVFAFTDPTVSTKTITFPNASLTVNAAADISGTTLASNVVTSSLTTVGALTSGSIATGFGSISTANNISTTGTGTVTSAGAFSGPTSGNTINGLIINNGDVTLGAGKLLVITGGAGNPAATNGTLWYDTTANKYKVVESGTVKTLCNTTDLGCGSAGAGIATVKEGGANVVTSALAANLAASDFVVTDETGGQAGIAIDYTNGQAAATGAKGFLTAADWNTFNGKQDVLWQKSAGAVSPAFITDDLLIGSSATSSARFSVVSGTGNTAVAGTFTASGNTTLGDAATDQITVTGEVLGATPLSFEGATDNNIYTVFAFTDPTVSTKTITFPNASLTVNAAADISGTTLASNVVTSSLTTVGALTSGSIATGFGSISTANNISTTGTGTVTSAGAFSGPTSGNTINGLIISSGALSGVSTLNASGQITSTVTTGTAPFVIASTTNVANLNASSLNGATFASPGNIGTGTAGTGTFTSLTATGLTNAGVVTNAAGGALSTLPGTATTVLHGNASGTPSFASVTGSDLAANIGISTTGNIGTTGTGTVTSAGTLTAQGALAVNGNTTLGDAATDQITVTGEVLGATPLSFEGATDNNIYTVFAFTDPTVSTKTITFPNASLTVNAAADISGTTLASNVVTSSLTTVGALTSGSIATGFGSISTANNISTTGTGTVTSAGAFSGPTSGNTINGLIISSGALSGVSTLNASGQITSTVTTGTAPFVIASTTNVANLNASSLNGATFASPGNIGTGTAGTGTFTSLTATGLTNAGVVTNAAGGALSTLPGTATTVLHGNASGTPSFASVTGSDLAANIGISTTGNIGTTGTGTVTSAGTLTAQGALAVNGNTTLGDTATDQITVTGEVLGATPLSFEGATDNNIYTVFAFTDPTVSTKTITFPNASLTVNAAADISGTTLASNVVTSSLTTVGALTSGSIATGFGSISTANNISTTGTGTVTSAGAFSGPTSGNTINGLIISSGALSGVSTLNASGQITSTVTTGTAPFVIASTTNVANLNASSLNGATFASPGNIGTGTAGTGTFTSLTATGLTNAGVVTNAAGGALSTLPGTATTVLHGNASGTPSFASVTGSDLAANIGISTTGNIGTTGTGTVTSAGTLTAQGALAVNGNTTLGDAATDQITVTGEVLGATPLSFEGATDNNIYTVFAFTDPTVSTKTITFPNASLTVNAAADISGTTLASNVVTSSLTTVGALTSGSIATGFGSISTANNISTTGTGTVTSAGAFSGPTSGNTINGLIISSGALSGVSTLNASGQITSTVTTGTAPFVIASTTNVANLNASSLNGATFASPGNIGTGTAGTGTFTSLTATGLTNAGVVTNAAGGALSTLPGTATTVLHGNASGTPSFASVTGSDLAANIGISTTGNIGTTGTGTVTSAGTLTAQGALAVNGNTTLGDAATDQITVTGEVLGATPLSFEGATDNNIYTVFAFTDPTVSTKTITFPNASLTVNAAADISGTTLASNVVTSSLTTVGALTSGSIATGFGSISTANNISTTGTGTVTSAGAFSGPTSGNTINGLIISSGALSGITGVTFTSGNLNLANGNITNANTISGQAGLTINSAAANGITVDEVAAGSATITIGGTYATSVVIGRSGQTTQIKSGTPAANGVIYSSDANGSLAFTGTGGAGTLCLLSVSGGVPSFGTCPGSVSAWSSITDPVSSMSRNMGNWYTNLTWGTNTGAGVNMFDLKDTTGNTGTGYVLNVANTGTSTAKPFRVTSQGSTIIDTTATGGLTLAAFTAAGTINMNNNMITNIGNAATDFDAGGGLTLASNLTLNAQSHIQFADSDSSNWVAFQAPAAIGTNYTWTLPSTDYAGCFRSDGAGNMTIAACGDTQTQTFTINGNYSVPSDALMVIVEAWGGGGGGGGGTGGSLGAARSGGGGGGGGAYTTSTYATATFGSAGTNVPVTIGGGGTGSNGSTGGAAPSNGGFGSPTCLSAVANCSGTMYQEAFGGGGGQGVGTAGNGGGGGGGANSVGTTSGTAGTGGTGGGPLGAAANTDNSGGGGAGGRTAAANPGAGGSGNFGGGGGGASSTAGANPSSAGGGSIQGGAAGGGGGTCTITTCNLRNGGAGGHAPGTSGGGGTAGSGAGGAGGPGTDGVGGGGDGGGGGANTNVNGATGGTGGVGGVRGGGGGGGGASAGTGTQTGGKGGNGGTGYLRTWTLRGTGADLAEFYGTDDPDLAAGDVVSIDPNLRSGVKKTEISYDQNTIGIISTKPGLTLGDIDSTGVKTVLVALAGRVPVKVSMENGDINPGDLLTPSSIPGVAMKATKAGLIIGQSLTKSDSEGPGYVVAFVKNSYAQGSKLVDLIPGLSPDNSIRKQQALAYFVSNRPQLENAISVSEITTDRLSAGMEIITPNVVTDELITRTISSPNGIPAITFDAAGNASFSGTLTADRIIAGQILGQNTQATVSAESTTPTPTPPIDMRVLGELQVSGAITADSDINLLGRPTFNADTGGFAVIKTGADEVEIKFDREYVTTPVINTTIANGSDIMSEQLLLTSNTRYIITRQSVTGFVIKLFAPAMQDIPFSWTAIAVKNPRTFESQPTSVSEIFSSPTPPATPSATVTPGVTVIPTETPPATESSTLQN